jgi:hypothetical protein
MALFVHSHQAAEQNVYKHSHEPISMLSEARTQDATLPESS